jgi:phosphoadenosine phosphosulfate reductase
MQNTLNGFEPTDQEMVASFNSEQLIARAVKLLKENEPSGGYYLAFSGGKDSCVIKKLAQIFGVRFEAWYMSTTIDPPELIHFIKREHKDVAWQLPPNGNMMKRVENRNSPPPTRMVRWCCEEYKENGGRGRTKIMGVRAAEGAKRARRWREVTIDDRNAERIVCPIVFWSDEQLWGFIREYKIPYCELYDQGWTRLGCVGCPLNNTSRIREFKRWPAFERNWKKAIISNWKKWKDVPTKKGHPRFHARFKTGEDFWKWWMQENRSDVMRQDCQSMLIWTNEPDDEPQPPTPNEK